MRTGNPFLSASFVFSKILKFNAGAVGALDLAHYKLTTAAWAVGDGVSFALRGGEEVFRL